MILYFLRHGCIEPFGQKCFVGQINVKLSRKGLQQAEYWAKALSDVPIGVIWSSDLDRTLKTAEIISNFTQAPLFPVRELREISLGKWEGLPMVTIQRRFPNLWEDRGANMDRFRPPDGENFLDLHARVLSFFHQHILTQSSGNVLIVTHAGVIRVLLCAVLRMPISNLFNIPSNYAGLTVMDFTDNKFRVLTSDHTPENVCKPFSLTHHEDCFSTQSSPD